jgi:plastocyanin
MRINKHQIKTTNQRVAVVGSCLALVLIASALAACGGSSAPRAEETPVTATSLATAPAVLGDTIVRMVPPGRFIPGKLRIAAGSTITWQDTSTSERHNVVFLDPGNKDAEDPRVSSHRGAIAENEAYAARLTTPGDYSYVCTFHEHEGMVGTLTVV